MRLLDTTLRDGNQAIRSGMNFQPDDQVQLFRDYALSASGFGMHYIEAGIPIAGPRSKEIVHSIAEDHRDNVRTSILGFSRAKEAEIDLVAATVQPAGRRGIALLTSVSDFQMDKFGGVVATDMAQKRSQMLEVFRRSVSHARSHNIQDLLVYLEDSTRADRTYLLELCQAYIESGATIISVPDTVGHMNDVEAYAELLQYLREETPGSERVLWSAHLHNDRGIAVATALYAARRNLMDIVEGTINGEGERTGNLSLATYLLNTHVDGAARYPDHARMEGLTQEGLRTLHGLSNAGSTALNIRRSPYMPGHGDFAHKTAAGMHQDGILKNPNMFRSYDPALIGVNLDVPFVYSDQSGRKGLAAILAGQGVVLSDKQLDRANADAYQMAVLLGGRVTDSLLHAAAWEAKSNGDPRRLEVDFDTLEVTYRHPTAPGAEVRSTKLAEIKGSIRIGETVHDLLGSGDGPTSAFVAALSKVLEREYGAAVDVEQWVERAATHKTGEGIQGTPGREASVWGFARMKVGTEVLDGYGQDTDASYASMKACLQAVNRWSAARSHESSS